ncbi:hypothetical protein [Ureibacillus aquaedulcis]|uniref:Uncharacterized protein n=1 Tax=Ureibacillus aquaedulcis TaxID=3058421 RepID=A0ABT8GL62_9BACL|nr:hypothetical protein [Ureibacillus sp. BA0131]MDN4492150.1 hypothetical protein [Ureibacillus sp. BA0131]
MQNKKNALKNRKNLVGMTISDVNESSNNIIDQNDNLERTNNHSLSFKQKDAEWLESLKTIKPVPNRSVSSGGCLGVVNSSNGKRLVISKEVIRNISCPDKILCSIDEDNALVLSVCFEDSRDGHTLKGKDFKNVIYSAALVEKITEIFELDFDNCTSQTVGKVENVTVEDNIYAYITK